MAGAVAAAASLAVATAAPAAPTWLTPVSVSPDTDTPIDVGDVVALPDGTAIVGYVRTDPTPCSPCLGHAEVVVRPPGGAFGPPHMLSAPGNDADARSLRLASDAAGNVTAVWSERLGPNYIIRTAVRPFGGDFGPAGEVSGGGADNRRPDVAIAGDVAVAAWLRGPTATRIVQAAIRPAGSTFFQAASDLSGPGVGSFALPPDEQPPAVAGAPTGAAIVAWERDNGGPNVIEAAVREPGGVFVTMPPIATDNAATGEHMHMPRVAMDATGRSTIAFSHDRYDSGTSSRRHVVRSAFRSLSGEWSAIEDVSDPDVNSANANYMDLALSPDNQAVLVWAANAPNVMQAAARASNSSFDEPEDISAPGTFSGDPAVRFDSGGNAVAVWQGSLGSSRSIQSATSPRGGNFGDVTEIETQPPPTTLFGPTPLELDGAGNGLTAYWRNQGGRNAVRAAGLDGAAPRLLSLNVPATTRALQPTAMSVAPFDVWSPLSTQWTFGDGAGATGNAVQHTYAAPGAYTVTVTTTDAVGNTRAESRAIQVSPADAAPAAGGHGSPAGQAGQDERARIPSGFVYKWKALRRYTTVRAMSVTEVPAGARVTFRCKGRGCPFKVRGKTFKEPVRIYRASNLFNRRGTRKRVARLRPRTQIEIRVTKADHIGRFATFVVRARRVPTSRLGCLSVDGKKTAC